MSSAWPPLAWRPRHASTVAVLGSSAAASEMLFCLEEALFQAGARTHLVVVSPSGRLADGLPSGALKPFQCRHLPALLAGPATGPASNASVTSGPLTAAGVTSGPLTAAALVEAVAADVARGRDQGYSIVDMLPAVNPLFGELFPRLSAGRSASLWRSATSATANWCATRHPTTRPRPPGSRPPGSSPAWRAG